MKELRYPITADTNSKKLAYGQRVFEVLRLKHNQKGKEYREKKITEGEWKTWLDMYFNPRHDAIMNEWGRLKGLLREETTYLIDLDNDFEDVVVSH